MNPPIQTRKRAPGRKPLFRIPEASARATALAPASPLSGRWAFLLPFTLLCGSLLHQACGAGYVLIGWSEAGLHEADGRDVSVFSLAPPYSSIRAQLIHVNTASILVRDQTGYTVTYEAMADATGSINTTSQGKGNFYDYAQTLWGLPLAPDEGLAGFGMPGPLNLPQPMSYDLFESSFIATGIPITPYDDQGRTNYYPMMRLVARDASGTVLATTQIVLPVSDALDCRACHGSGSQATARPAAGWVWDPDPDRDYKLNILRSHDDHFLGSSTYSNVLSEVGYDLAGLVATVLQDGQPILCIRCHQTEAFPGTGATGMRPFTQLMHTKHAYVPDPQSGSYLTLLTESSACLTCHARPESVLQRGVHHSAVTTNGALAMQCQNCHGTMLNLGTAGRRGWMEEPQCQSCHTGSATVNNGQILFTNVFVAPGQVRQTTNPLFATRPNTPETGLSLYRDSQDHGSLLCAACHGPAHAEVPTVQTNDNFQSQLVQGKFGILGDCAGCHVSTPVPKTGGPHGMHPVDASWARSHSNGGSSGCQACHGAGDTGTELSSLGADRTFNTTENGNPRLFWKATRVGCYDCHNGPNGSDGGGSAISPPTVSNAAPAPFPAGAPLTIPLHGSDPAGRSLTFRIVSQPLHGSVSLSNNVATYFDAPGWIGADSFTFCAQNGYRDSNLGSVSVRVNSGNCQITAQTLVPAAAFPNSPVPFRASATLAHCVGSLAYDWDFGDGSPHGSGVNVAHSYTTAADYPWILTVTGGGALQTVNGVITISPTLGPPVALAMTGLGYMVQLSWPWDSIPVSLEGTPDLTQPYGWQPIYDQPLLDQTNMTLYLFMDFNQQFFRLRRVP